MAVSSIVALLGAMTIIAMTPDGSAAVVIARSASSGLTHGLTVVLGIIVGDVVLIALAFSGLAFVAESMSGAFLIIKFVGAAYLLWAGSTLLLRRSAVSEATDTRKLPWHSNLMCGLLITLSDPKAIVFYLSFLPAYLDLSTATASDAFLVFLIATLSIGIAKGSYAYFGDRARSMLRSPKTAQVINFSSGSVMLCTAGVLLAQA